MQDLRVALRVMWKHPGFAAGAVLTLAIAVGGASAIFSVLNAVILRPLPYPNAERLTIIRDASPRFPEFSVSPGRFSEWQARTRVFDGIAASQGANLNLTGTGDPERLRAALVTPNLFDVLGAPPLLGRPFTAADDLERAGDVVVLSESLWRSRYGADPEILGRSLLLNDRPVTVVAVMPSTFAFPSELTQAWRPWILTPQERQTYGSHYVAVVARMKPDVSIEMARDDLARAAREIESIDGNQTWTTVLLPMHFAVVRAVRDGIVILSAAVAVVLLVACVNIANLLLARGLGRQRELGVRAALGASRLTLVKQMLIENVVVGMAGTALGLLMGWGMLRLMLAAVPTTLPRAATIGLDGATLVFAIALAFLTPLLFGLLPALQVSRTDLRGLLAQGGRGPSALRARTRAGLIVAEVALAVMLVAGATLLMRSFARMTAVSPGFQPDRAVTLALSLPSTKYSSNEHRAAFWRTFVERAGQLSGVTAAGVTQSVPMAGDFVTTFQIPDRTSEVTSEMPNTNFYAVSSGYFEAMGIPLLRGRVVGEQDTTATPRVIVISKSLADKFFDGDDPIGKTLRVNQGPNRDYAQIVGVVGNIKQYGLASVTTMQAYEPIGQHPYFGTLSVVARAGTTTEAVTAGMRALMRELDPSVPVTTARTMTSIVEASVGPQRFTTTILGVFAGIALLLAAIGVYGLVSFAVGQRAPEIGVRMALGARPTGVLWLVFSHALRFVLVGAAVGIVGGLLAGQLLEGQLYEVSVRDPLAFALAPAVIVFAAALACLAPARRALRVDPVHALRGE